MKYVYNQTAAAKSYLNIKAIVALVLAAVISLTLSAGVFAHGGPGTPATEVAPADKNCMGQLAKMHAQDPNSDKGLAGSLANRHHGGFIGDTNNDETVGEEMHAFKDYCKGE